MSKSMRTIAALISAFPKPQTKQKRQTFSMSRLNPAGFPEISEHQSSTIALRTALRTIPAIGLMRKNAFSSRDHCILRSALFITLGQAGELKIKNKDWRERRKAIYNRFDLHRAIVDHDSEKLNDIDGAAFRYEYNVIGHSITRAWNHMFLSTSNDPRPFNNTYDVILNARRLLVYECPKAERVKGHLSDSSTDEKLQRRTILQLAISESKSLASGMDVKSLFCKPLWPEGVPEVVRLSWINLKSNLGVDDPIGVFWQRWYQSILDGRPISWEAQGAISELPEAVWKEKKGTRLNGTVEELLDKAMLADDLKRLRVEFDEILARSFGKTQFHNNPPREDRIFPKDYVAAKIQELAKLCALGEAELRKHKVDYSILRELRARLIEFLTWLKKYSAKSADTFVQSGVKVVGAGSATALAAELSVQGGARRVAELILEFLEKYSAF